MGTKRTKTFGLRLTEKEAELLKRKAARCSLTSSEYLRQVIHGKEPAPFPAASVCCLIEQIDSLHANAADSKTSQLIDEIIVKLRAIFLENKGGT